MIQILITQEERRKGYNFFLQACEMLNEPTDKYLPIPKWLTKKDIDYIESEADRISLKHGINLNE